MSETNPSAADPGDGGTTTQGAADPVTEPGTTAGETAEARAARLEAEVADKDRQIAEYLRMKSNAEQTARENERLRSQLPTAQPPDAGQHAARIQRAQMRWQQLANDPNVDDAVRDDALTLLALTGAVQTAPMYLNDRIDLLEVPKDERADVERIRQERAYRGERISADTAKELLQARRLAAEAERVRKQADELRRAQEAKERGVVQTRTVGIPASEAREGEMTFRQFRQAWDSGTPEQQAELMRKTAGGTKLKPD